MDLTLQISTTELVWILFALIGIVINSWSLLDSWHDLQTLRHAEELEDSEEEVLEIYAFGRLTRDIIRTAIQFLLLFAGVIASFRPNVNQTQTIGAWAIVLCLFGVSGMLSFLALLDRYNRYRIGRALRRQTQHRQERSRTDQQDGRTC